MLCARLPLLPLQVMKKLMITVVTTISTAKANHGAVLGEHRDRRAQEVVDPLQRVVNESERGRSTVGDPGIGFEGKIA